MLNIMVFDGLLDGAPNDAGEKKQRVLLLQFRNLGDAVILGGLAEAISRANPSVEVHLLTRPESVAIFRNNPFIAKVHSSIFPIVDMGKFIRFGAFHLLWVAIKLRLLGFKYVANVFGDLRENILGWLISPNGNTSLIWDVDHPHRNQIRTGFTFLVKNKVHVPADEISIYTAVGKLAKFFDAGPSVRPHLFDERQQDFKYVCGEEIGLHMGASQPCRLWPKRKWLSLAHDLQSLGYKVVVFGGPGERPKLEALFATDDNKGVKIVTGSFDDFFKYLTRLKAVVCLDSFPAHAAYAVGTPTLIINGANLADIWRPPVAHVVDGGKNLACHPCFNSPSCEEGAPRYACIRDIEVKQILNQLSDLLEVFELGR
jgi:ADP-heptose:LPS heptosyltransferase